ncbi:hypothetical protein ALC53_03502, partial [Atta colombica]
ILEDFFCTKCFSILNNLSFFLDIYIVNLFFHDFGVFHLRRRILECFRLNRLLESQDVIGCTLTTSVNSTSTLIISLLLTSTFPSMTLFTIDLELFSDPTLLNLDRSEFTFAFLSSKPNSVSIILFSNIIFLSQVSTPSLAALSLFGQQHSPNRSSPELDSLEYSFGTSSPKLG